jgi:hypothetical protein
MMTESLGGQLLTLVILAIPVACVTWTVIHEEVFREVREYFGRKSRTARHLPARKFYYLFTCEYCFSHYVAILALVLTQFTLLLPGWRGYILAGFGLVWLANVYMALFVRLRLDIKHEVGEIAKVERQLEETPPARPQRRA